MNKHAFFFEFRYVFNIDNLSENTLSSQTAAKLLLGNDKTVKYSYYLARQFEN